MKILKYILLFLLIAAIGLAIYASMQPDAYEVNRTRVLKAPVNVVYDNVSDYKNWEDWGPWKEEDPSMTFAYGDQTKGEGATYSWSGKDGNGSMKMLKATPNEAIANELTFEGMDPAESYWNFKPVENGTEVTWGMKVAKSPFIMKVFSAVSGGYDNMMGPMFDRGLEKLDSITQIRAAEVEKISNAFTLGPVSKKSMDAQHFIGYPHKANMQEADITKIFMESMPKAGKYAAEKGWDPKSYIPSAIFNKWDYETGEVDFLVGLILDKKVDLAEGMEHVKLPKGDIVMISKYGNYGSGDEKAHLAIDKFLKENNLTINGPVYEMYVNDPTLVKPNEIQTDIYYPVK